MNYYKVTFPATMTDQETEIFHLLISQGKQMGRLSIWFWYCFVGRPLYPHGRGPW